MVFKILETGVKKSESKITLTRSKYIRFSSFFIEENKLENKKYIRIYIDKKEGEILIGFEFINEKKDKSLKLSTYGKSKGYSGSGSSLFSELDLKKDEMKNHFILLQLKKNLKGKNYL